MNKPARIHAPFEARHSARFTTAEFVRMLEVGAFDDIKVELIDGELERVNPPMSRHANRQAAIIIALAAALGPDSAKHLMGEVGIDLGDDTVLGCDVALLIRPVAEHRMLRPSEIMLVVEVAETTVDRDVGMKRVKYARASIPFYWVFDGEREVVKVFTRPLRGDYADVHTIAFGQPLPVPGTDATIIIT